jgi:hypothetical protein
MTKNKYDKPGRPRFTAEQLIDKQLKVVTELEALKAIPNRKRTARQWRRFYYLSAHAVRIERRITTGTW